MKRQVTLASTSTLAVFGVLCITFANSALINAQGWERLWIVAGYLAGGALFYGASNVLLAYMNERMPGVDLLDVEEESEEGPDES